MFNIRNEALSKASFQKKSESICLIEHVGGPRNSANHNADHISQGPSSALEPTHPRWTSTILHYIYKHMVYFNAWQPQLCWAAIHNAKLALRIAHPSCFIHPCACDIFGFTTYIWHMHMIVLQVHLRKPCYDLSFLAVIRFTRFNIALIR